MAYQITDDGASIHFVGDAGELLVMKHNIQQVSVVSGDTIEIRVSGFLRSIFFHYGDVTAPVAGSAVLLRDAINTMVGTAPPTQMGL